MKPYPEVSGFNNSSNKKCRVKIPEDDTAFFILFL
jgi:hypothetical protein